MCENTNEPGIDGPQPFDFEYFAFGLNQTHLDIAKQRLETMFDAVLILGRPESYGQLDRWLGKNESGLPRKNKNDDQSTRLSLNFTREEFYRYNALDKQLYEFALELSLSKSAENKHF